MKTEMSTVHLNQLLIPLSRSMRIDLLKNNIKVTNIAPGMAETEFSIVRFKGDKEKADAVYKGIDASDRERTLRM